MISLSLVTPSKKLFTDMQVEEVFVPTERGEINILPGHGPLMAMLDIGVLKYKAPGQDKLQNFAISWGYLEVSGDRVTVLAETAETPHEIDIARAEIAKEASLKALDSIDTEQKDFVKYQFKLQRAMVRLQLAEDSSQLTGKTDKTH